MTTLDNLAAFLDYCYTQGVSVELDLATNMWIPYRVDTANHIAHAQSEWWPKPDDTPWTESAVWYAQTIRYVEATVAHPESIALWTMVGNYQLGGSEPVTWDFADKPEIPACTERFVKEVWPRFCEAATRPVGSPILLPIYADVPYWATKTPAERLSSVSNVKRWLVDELRIPPDYWVMTTYPCCQPARDGIDYLSEIVRILGPENAHRLISTDFKGTGHRIDPCIVDKSALSDVDVLRWHFDKITEYGMGGWWIWAYRDSGNEATGLRRRDDSWKADLVQVVRERALGRTR